MLVIAFLSGCGGTPTLDQPHPPPEPWPMTEETRNAPDEAPAPAPAPVAAAEDPAMAGTVLGILLEIQPGPPVRLVLQPDDGDKVDLPCPQACAPMAADPASWAGKHVQIRLERLASMDPATGAPTQAEQAVDVVVAP
jgi:hypothetical protein